MKNLFLLLAVVCFFAFSASPMQKSGLAEKNKADLTKIKIGMNENELREALGNPYKIKTIERGNNWHKIFYYITKVTPLIDRKFIPIILKNDKIIGWGNHYYRHYFDMDNLQKHQTVSKSKSGKRGIGNDVQALDSAKN